MQCLVLSNETMALFALQCSCPLGRWKCWVQMWCLWARRSRSTSRWNVRVNEKVISLWINLTLWGEPKMLYYGVGVLFFVMSMHKMFVYLLHISARWMKVLCETKPNSKQTQSIKCAWFGLISCECSLKQEFVHWWERLPWQTLLWVSWGLKGPKGLLTASNVPCSSRW